VTEHHRLDAARRAGAGWGARPGRAIVPRATVRETVAVALEARGRSGSLRQRSVLPAAHRRERQRAAETDDIVSFLGLGRYADSYIADLVHRHEAHRRSSLDCSPSVPMCCAWTSPPPELLSGKRRRRPLPWRSDESLGAAMIVIEHDMPLIMSISDRMYCLNWATSSPRDAQNRCAMIS
jgi:hypothetical protein